MSRGDPPLIVLAIDTSHEFGSLALTTGQQLLDEKLLQEPNGFSGILFEQISHLLKRNNIAQTQIDLYAAAAGPGSFTGVRIGLTAAKALAEAHGKPCFGISNLQAMARFSSTPHRAVVLDARRGEIYGALYGQPHTEEVVAPFPQWLASLPEGVGEFLAFDFLPFATALNQSRFAGALRTTVPRAIAGAVAATACERFLAGENGDVALLDANYVRRSDAELLFKPLAD